MLPFDAVQCDMMPNEVGKIYSSVVAGPDALPAVVSLEP
jgi:hypothetical protein